MIVTVEKVREGFETLKAQVDEKQASLEAEKALEREAFEKALEAKYADQNARLEQILSVIVYTEDIEVPDEVEETVEQEQTQPPTYL